MPFARCSGFCRYEKGVMEWGNRSGRIGRNGWLRAGKEMKSNEIEETRGTIGPIAIRALAVGAQSVGAIAVGAVALSAVAIGFIAIGRLVIGRAKIKRLEIGELRVTRLQVTDSIITPPQPPQ